MLSRKLQVHFQGKHSAELSLQAAAQGGFVPNSQCPQLQYGQGSLGVLGPKAPELWRALGCSMAPVPVAQFASRILKAETAASVQGLRSATWKWPGVPAYGTD